MKMKLKTAAVTALWVPGLFAQAPVPNPRMSLDQASLEDLMNLEVTSVSKKEQSLSKAGAAVFVITMEDIRRSGATNVPDLLRMVPGVEVAQVDANQWAISIRGFNAVYSNKVLVLIDGRSMFSDTFSGVYWDQVRVPLEDIDRIEVIRGPGGTVWGANAVNGVINIITRNSADTKGTLLSAQSGSKENLGALAQYGGTAASTGAYRVYAEYSNELNSRFPGGARAFDAWHGGQLGFRSDWKPDATDVFSVQGEFQAFEGAGTSRVVDQASLQAFRINQPVENTSGDVLARWAHTLANGSELSLQVYDTIMRRNNVGLGVANNNLDVDLEHHTSIWSRHDIVWGLDLRIFNDSMRPKTPYAPHLTNPAWMNLLATAFIQDEIRIAPSVFLTLGSKFEHNDFTGFQFEPSAQLVWKASDRHSFWASAAHAIRQPDEVDNSVQVNEGLVNIPGAGRAILTIAGNPHLNAERMNDYEIGYRAQLNDKLAIDLTGFLSFYKSLTTFDLGIPYVGIRAGAPALILPMVYGNAGSARDYGVEVFARWNVNRRWEISPGFSMLRMKTADAPGVQDFYMPSVPGSSPRYQPQVHSTFHIRQNLAWDSSVKHVSTLSYFKIPGYLRVDSQLRWKLGESAELSLVGQNLSSGRHIEFTDFAADYLSAEVARTAFARITWRY